MGINMIVYVAKLWLLYVIGGTAAQNIPITGKLKQLFLDKHNEYRRNEGATNMNKLVWNATVADVTRDWIGNCDFEHMMKDWGENLYYETMSNSIEDAITHAIKEWFDEKYLPANPRSCGQRCHYTQVVWAETTQVGCAVRKCNPLMAFGSAANDASYVACFYWPKGNWVGEKMYLTGGAPCSKCLIGQKCENKLCTGTGVMDPADCVDDQGHCAMWAKMGECNNNPNFMLKKCKKSCKVC